ncbi:hydrogenase subunit MbhD domain-containing protein [Methylosinus sp. KRF6]|uniref:hydrogenase subunit MbhD domain-containing protein n=1 Tax=Methylosinus sp. KRF6 TaxID=2846853 RepID=UPI001C0DB178|nr:hydrogenase subunit MbhD domain-containing protein [Methylosinus sp. KRF6]MBU3888517.1 DUF4040 domain-containing protein [Methylosinus sp. KRF6]
MTAAFAFDLLLCGLIVLVALGAAIARDHFVAIILFVVYGLFVAIAWVRLDATDVALTEAAIGAGLSGLLLISAAARRPRRETATDAAAHRVRASFSAIARLVVCAAGAAALLAVVATLPERTSGLRPLVERNLAASGVANPVTAVLLNFRGYDTLLESIVLLVSLVGIWSLTPDRLWGEAPGARQHARPDGVLANFGRALPSLGLLIGAYLLWAGADAPGGAFQAATVLAAVWLLVAMAGLTEPPPQSCRRLRLLLILGPGFFLSVASVGAFAGTFLGYSAGLAKPAIVAIEALLTLSIAATLAGAILGPPRRPS